MASAFLPPSIPPTKHSSYFLLLLLFNILPLSLSLSLSCVCVCVPQPVDLLHMLRLYPEGGAGQQAVSKKVSE